MANKDLTYIFAKKWLEKFKDKETDYSEQIKKYMRDECIALGFGLSVSKENIELEKNIDEITDIYILAPLIYSKCSEEEKLDYNWFIKALTRLVELSDDPYKFCGTLEKIKIVSNTLFDYESSIPEGEVKQSLTINSKGRVWLSGYRYKKVIKKYKKIRSEVFKIDKIATENIFEAVSGYFNDRYFRIYADNTGEWDLELTNSDGKVYQYRGSLYGKLRYGGEDLSELIRETLDMYDLYLFDGNFKEEIIEKISLEYNRKTKMELERVPMDIIWEYSELLVIDRTTKTVEYIQDIGTGSKFSRKYETYSGVGELLEKFESLELFSAIPDRKDEEIVNPDEIKEYRITIDYKKNSQYILSGRFSKNSLPKDYKKFITIMSDFMKNYGLGEIFLPMKYKKKSETDLIFCSVVFQGGQTTYYYLTEDETIEIGDLVVVPVGYENHETVVRVVDIEYYDRENTPIPIEKIKSIIRKLKQ